MEPLYNIYFAGEVMPGQDPANVRAALGRLFKADDATLDKLFSGKSQLIKRDCDKATAMKYKQAMEQAGARAIIEGDAPSMAAQQTTQSAADKIAALAGAPDAGSYADSHQQTGQSEAAASPGGFDLAAAGSDVLKPEERSEPVVVDVDTTGMDVDETAQRLSEEPPPPPPAPDTSHLSMGEVGEDIPVLDSGLVPVSPNTDALTLSPEGTDFSDCQAPEPVPPAVDLSSIELAPEGSDVLEEEYRGKETAAAPDTDHISLEK